MLFSTLTFKMQNKKLNLKKNFCLLLFEGKKDKKKSKRCHQTVGIKVFLNIFLADRRIRIRFQIHISANWNRIRDTKNQVDPDLDSDPDPEHCL
jgi:hypothetical protein